MNDDQPTNGLSDSDCEELLAGRRTDLPVGAVLSSLRGPLGDRLPGEAAAMAAFRAAALGGTAAGRRAPLSARIAAASIGGSVVLLGGVAAAASGQVRHDIGNVIGVHMSHHHGSPNHPGVLPTPTPTPAAPGIAPTGTPTGGTGHGKAHQGHGNGVGIGETSQPSHPAHPSHPATPTHPAHPDKARRE